jgi:hypothetical protein
MVVSLWQRFVALISSPKPVKEPDLSDTLVDIAKRPLIERVQVVFTRLDLKPFQDYLQTDGHGRQISTAHQTIDECTSDILTHVNDIERTKFIPQGRGEYARVTQPINRFFITKEGCYLPSVYGALIDLKSAVLDLCKAVEDNKESDYYSYNLRMLNSLLFALEDFGLQLHDLSEHIKSRS